MTFADAFYACLGGLGSALSWPAFGFLIVGVLTGGLVGILPGLGGAATLAMLLPFSVGLPASETFALLIGVAAVTSTTGDLTSILVGIPGEAISAATLVDGHPMAVRGEAGRAIGASLFSSLAGSVVGALTLTAMIPLALVVARSVGSPELFMLALLGISFMASLSGSSRLKGLAMGGLGLMIASVGMDRIGATPRFTFGQLFLWDGVGAIPVSLGLFAIPEIVQLGTQQTVAPLGPPAVPAGLADGVRDVRRLWRLVLQSSLIGSALGVLPGVGAGVSQWVAYGYAARRGSEEREFGRGAVEGVIAPSAANNATLGGSLVPGLAFGIPGGVMSTLLISALIMKGLVPGPSLLAPESQGGQLTLVFALAWLLVSANVIAVMIAWVSTDFLIRLTKISAGRMVPFLLLLTFVGAFNERQAIEDLLVTGALGGLGLALVRYDWPRAPLLLGVALGPLAENRLFLSMDAYGSNWLTRPGVLMVAVVIVAGLVLPLHSVGRRRTAPVPATVTPTVPVASVLPLPSTLAAASWARGERLLVLVLIIGLGMAFSVAARYPPQAALVPRLVAAVTLVLLLAAFILQHNGALRSTAAVQFAKTSKVTSAWIPVFLLLIWGFGFVVGAPLAVLGYLFVAARERPLFAALAASATFGALYFVLFRLLHVAFPTGPLLTRIASWL